MPFSGVAETKFGLIFYVWSFYDFLGAQNSNSSHACVQNPSNFDGTLRSLNKDEIMLNENATCRLLVWIVHWEMKILSLTILFVHSRIISQISRLQLRRFGRFRLTPTYIHSIFEFDSSKVSQFGDHEPGHMPHTWTMRPWRVQASNIIVFLRTRQ